MIGCNTDFTNNSLTLNMLWIVFKILNDWFDHEDINSVTQPLNWDLIFTIDYVIVKQRYTVQLLNAQVNKIANVSSCDHFMFFSKIYFSFKRNVCIQKEQSKSKQLYV